MLKLHLGCGENYIKGYTNIDKYSGKADIQEDAITLESFEDNSVDEILAEHFLEHLSRREILLALKKWNSLLKKNGLLKIEVPDFVWCLQNFLNSPEKERYSKQYWNSGAISAIFGMQSSPGEFHKFGFTKEYLESILFEIGFSIVSTDTAFIDMPCQVIRVVAKK